MVGWTDEMESERQAAVRRSIAYCEGMIARRPDLGAKMGAEVEKLQRLLPPNLRMIDGQLTFSS